jgi:hypothetical protein
MNYQDKESDDLNEDDENSHSFDEVLEFWDEHPLPTDTESRIENAFNSWRQETGSIVKCAENAGITVDQLKA